MRAFPTPGERPLPGGRPPVARQSVNSTSFLRPVQRPTLGALARPDASDTSHDHDATPYHRRGRSVKNASRAPTDRTGNAVRSCLDASQAAVRTARSCRAIGWSASRSAANHAIPEGGNASADGAWIGHRRRGLSGPGFTGAGPLRRGFAESAGVRRSHPCELPRPAATSTPAPGSNSCYSTGGRSGAAGGGDGLMRTLGPSPAAP